MSRRRRPRGRRRIKLGKLRQTESAIWNVPDGSEVISVIHWPGEENERQFSQFSDTVQAGIYKAFAGIPYKPQSRKQKKRARQVLRKAWQQIYG